MVSPVAGLTLTRTHPTGAFAAYTATERAQPVVFRARGVTIPSVDTAYLLLEMGATGAGMGVWYQTGVIKARCGSGGGSTSNPDHAFAEAAVTKGITIDITVEFDPANRRLRMWFGDALVGNATSSQAFAEWAGGDAAGYGSTGSSTPTGVPTTSWPSALPNPLEAYVNQRSTWTEGGATGVSGTGTGSFLATIAAAGAVAIAGIASSGFSASASSAGRVATSGFASGSFTAQAASTAKAPIKGSASATFSTAATGTGQAPNGSSAFGAFTTDVAASGKVSNLGAGSGDFATDATAAGSAFITGTGQGAFTSQATATGIAESAGGGNASGVFSVSASSTGQVRVSGTGSATFLAEQSSAGSVPITGNLVSGFTLTAAAFGGAPTLGIAQGQFTTSVAARAVVLEPAGLPPLSRTIAPAFERRDIHAGSTVTQWPTKDPDDILDYAIDWGGFTDGDSIVDHEWIIPDGLTLDRSDFVADVAIAWLSGGVAPRTYRITSRVTTASGRRIDRSASLLVVPR